MPNGIPSQGASQARAELKPCIACAEEIKHQAQLCRFCGTQQSNFKGSNLVEPESESIHRMSPQSPQSMGLTLALNTAKAGWVLAGGFAAWLILGFLPNSVYGPWQPVAVFSLGVFVVSLASLIAVSVALSPDRPRAKPLITLRSGLITWTSAAFAIMLVAFVIGINYSSSGQIDAELEASSAEASTAPAEVSEKEPEAQKTEIKPLPKADPIIPQKSQYELDIEKSATEQLRTCQALFAHDFTSMNNSWGQPGHAAIVLDHYNRLWSSLQNQIPLGDFNFYRDRMLDALLLYGQIAEMYEEIDVYTSWEVATPQQNFYRQYENLVAIC